MRRTLPHTYLSTIISPTTAMRFFLNIFASSLSLLSEKLVNQISAILGNGYEYDENIANCGATINKKGCCG
jgi:hypothetical protein